MDMLKIMYKQTCDLLIKLFFSSVRFGIDKFTRGLLDKERKLKNCIRGLWDKERKLKNCIRGLWDKERKLKSCIRGLWDKERKLKSCIRGLTYLWSKQIL